MKYFFFLAALLGVLPAVILILSNRFWLRWFIPCLLLPVVVFNETAINFYSNEYYRGTSRGLEISIIYLVAGVVLLSFMLLRKPMKIFPDIGSKLYLVYFLLSFPSIMNAENEMFSIFELWKMVMMYLFFLAVYNYLEYSEGDFEIFLISITGVVLIDFFVIIRQHFQGYYQARGVFPHQNSLAMCMMMAGMLFFSRSFNARDGIRSKLYFLVFLVASASLVRTYSRGALFCYPLSGMINFFCSMINRLSFRKLYLTGIMMLIAAVGIIIFLPRVIDRFEKAPESSGETRKNFAIAAANMMRDEPILGVGLNNWGIKINPPYTYSRHRDPKKGYTEDYKDGIVETIYLLVGAECGLPCLAALLCWFGYYWFAAFRLMVRLRGTRFFYVPVGVFAALSGAYLQSTLEWILKQQINFMWLMMFFAFISYLIKHGKELIEAEKREKLLRAS